MIILVWRIGTLYMKVCLGRWHVFPFFLVFLCDGWNLFSQKDVSGVPRAWNDQGAKHAWGDASHKVWPRRLRHTRYPRHTRSNCWGATRIPWCVWRSRGTMSIASYPLTPLTTPVGMCYIVLDASVILILEYTWSLFSFLIIMFEDWLTWAFTSSHMIISWIYPSLCMMRACAMLKTMFCISLKKCVMCKGGAWEPWPFPNPF